MPSVKGIVGGGSAARYSGSAVDAIAASSIATTIAAAKRGESSVEPRTSVIGELLKGGLTNGTVNRPIGNA